jgi:hypothetical protein
VDAGETDPTEAITEIREIRETAEAEAEAGLPRDTKRAPRPSPGQPQ